MPIDFHAPENRHSYATRWADVGWAEAIARIVDPVGKHVLDIGCGGGTYTRAWIDLGAAEVTGLDFSAPMVQTAAERCADLPQARFRQGDATATGLPSGRADIVFERALIHHIADRTALVAEAHRLLAPGGTYIVQDRTPDDSSLPGAPDYPRGYLLARFPRLVAIENARRPTTEDVIRFLRSAGFVDRGTFTLWEIRQTHTSFDALFDDLRRRNGRSILHELTDAEIEEFITDIRPRLPEAGPVTERDRWTLWWARKPSSGWDARMDPSTSEVSSKWCIRQVRAGSRPNCDGATTPTDASACTIELAGCTT